MNDREQTQTIRFAIIFIIIYIILVEANCSFVLIWFKPKLITHVRFEYNFFFFHNNDEKKIFWYGIGEILRKVHSAATKVYMRFCIGIEKWHRRSCVACATHVRFFLPTMNCSLH